MVFSRFLEGKWGLSFSFGWFSSLKFFGCMVILAVRNIMVYGEKNIGFYCHYGLWEKNIGFYC